MIYPYSGQVVCPACNQVDMIQRVSAVVSGGYATSSWSGSSSGLGYSRGSGLISTQGSSYGSGTSQTELSKKLSPPKEPTYTSPWLWCIAIPFIPFFAPVGFAAIQLLGTVVGILLGLLTSAIYIGLIGGIIYGCSTAAKKKRPRFEFEKAGYSRAIGKWNNLYYCHRDDGVFLPNGDSPLVPIGMMMHFLYS